VVHPEWIKRYGKMPDTKGNPAHQVTFVGIDLAISEKESADYTAMVPVSVFCDHEGRWAAYLHPNPVNERLDYPTARERIKSLSRELGYGTPVTVYIESVGYQLSMVQDLRHEGFPAEEFQVHGQDKRARLSLVTHLIKEGIVRFPEQGCELLENQLIGFGTEKHDDLADAFAIALHQVLKMIATPALMFPKDSTMTHDGSYEAEMREIEAWYAERDFEFKQGRMDRPHWFVVQDERCERIRKASAREAARQHHEAQQSAEKRNAEYELSVYGGLMRPRLRRG
jgi:predicted phage terminase large subunit-like protein